MSRSARSRLEDILAACEAISRYLTRLDTSEELVFDAIRARLIDIGEAAKDLPAAVTSVAPEVPWALITGMRDHLAHRYFDTTHAVVLGTARYDIPVLAAATTRILDALD